ncbi:MAG: hypothetical protein ACOH2H_15400 [Cypionkella sp.]
MHDEIYDNISDEIAAALRARPLPAFASNWDQGTSRNNRSTIALSIVSTSGRDAISSNVCRKRLTSRFPSWWLARMTAPIMSITVLIACVKTFCRAKTCGSSIRNYLSFVCQQKPKQAPTDSATLSGKGQNDA